MESNVPLHTILFLSPQFPASLHHFSMQSNVSVALVLLCFAGQWPPQQIRRSIEGTLGPSAWFRFCLLFELWWKNCWKIFCGFLIHQVRPKMILTLTASIMLWSLSHKARKAVEGSFEATWAGVCTGFPVHSNWVITLVAYMKILTSIYLALAVIWAICHCQNQWPYVPNR